VIDNKRDGKLNDNREAETLPGGSPQAGDEAAIPSNIITTSWDASSSSKSLSTGRPLSAGRSPFAVTGPWLTELQNVEVKSAMPLSKAKDDLVLRPFRVMSLPEQTATGHGVLRVASKENDHGVELATQGHFTAAASAFRTAADRAPARMEPRYNLALLFARQQRWDKAITECQKGSSFEVGALELDDLKQWIEIQRSVIQRSDIADDKSREPKLCWRTKPELASISANRSRASGVFAESSVEMPSFGSLHTWVDSRRKEKFDYPTPENEFRNSFEAALDLVDIVSFDAFDTLIVRQVNHPTDVFLLLERMSAFQARSPWPKQISEMRREAENQARRAMFESQRTGEVTLKEIYVVLCRLANLPECHALSLVEAEEQVELSLCLANPPVRECFELALHRAKQIMVVSDTYHSQEFVYRLLKAAGYSSRRESIAVSSEKRMNKQSGQLFELLFRPMGIPRNRILHLGDHPVSDRQSPARLGIRSLLHPFRACADRADTIADKSAAISRSFVKAACSYENKCGDNRNDFWWSIGHGVFGPLFAGFCAWLKRCFKNDGIERAYFLLRDF
jgi:FMN phosphatase YigB (HAD superfamily)